MTASETMTISETTKPHRPILNTIKYMAKQFEKLIGFELRWPLWMVFLFFHTFGPYWAWKYAFPAKWQTLAFALIMYVVGGLGLGSGAHRLFTHKSYKATTGLKLFLLMCFSSAGQSSVYQWVRDHRLHHKFSDTDADPHNVNRGLFFSHIGWLLLKKNEAVLRNGKQIDMSDIKSDWILMFHHKHLSVINIIFCFLLPSLIGVVLWGESWRCAVAWQCFIRYLAILHATFCINSLGHSFGYSPYNKYISAKNNVVLEILSVGEGGHNYHHAFPFDYKSAEFLDFFNFGTYLIQVCAKFGWAYDLKEATPEMIQSVKARLGDGSLNNSKI